MTEMLFFQHSDDVGGGDDGDSFKIAYPSS